MLEVCLFTDELVPEWRRNKLLWSDPLSLYFSSISTNTAIATNTIQPLIHGASFNELHDSTHLKIPRSRLQISDHPCAANWCHHGCHRYIACHEDRPQMPAMLHQIPNVLQGCYVLQWTEASLQWSTATLLCSLHLQSMLSYPLLLTCLEFSCDPTADRTGRVFPLPYFFLPLPALDICNQADSHGIFLSAVRQNTDLCNDWWLHILFCWW